MTGPEKPPKDEPESAPSTYESPITYEQHVYSYELLKDMLGVIIDEHKAFTSYDLIDATPYFADLARVESLIEKLDSQGVNVSIFKMQAYGLRLLAETISKPIIVDTFKDNVTREAFRNTFKDEAPFEYSFVELQNLMRVNNFTNGITGYEFVEPLLSEFNEVLHAIDPELASAADYIDELKALTRQIITQYKRIKDRDTNEERVRLVTAFRDKLTGVFYSANHVLTFKLEELSKENTSTKVSE